MRLGDLPSNFATYICEHVFRAERPVALVLFEEDGSLQMLCDEAHDFKSENVRVVGVGHLLDRHKDLQELHLPKGYEASLTEGKWQVQRFVSAGIVQ